MALAVITTWTAGQNLTAAALNAEINNILNNPVSLISPLTGSLEAGTKNITALDELAFTDAAAAATASGRLRRNGAVLEWASANNGGLKVGSVTGVPVANALYQQGAVKAYAVLERTSAPAGPTLVDGFNIASVSGTISNPVITWDRDFSGTSYAVVGTVQATTGDRTVQLTAQSAGSCTFGFPRPGESEAGELEVGARLHVLAVGDQ